MKYLSEDPSKCGAWLAMAKDDLKLALGGEKIRYELLCYHCQQAGEKALKAILIQRLGKYPKTHSLDELISELEKINFTIPDEIKEAARSSSRYQQRPMFPFKFPWILSPFASVSLTDHAEKTRYPGEYVSLDDQAYKHALVKANAIVAWVEQQIRIENQKDTE